MCDLVALILILWQCVTLMLKARADNSGDVAVPEETISNRKAFSFISRPGKSWLYKLSQRTKEKG